MKNVLEVKNLSVYYYAKRAVIKAVENVSFSIGEGEIVGLVGESGCGKSTLASALMRLVPHPGKIVSGEIILNGKNILELSDEEIRRIRGSVVSMVFQDPMTCLDPLMRIGDQIVETILAHTDMSSEEAKKYAMELLEIVGIKRDRYYDYPHQLSGGMRQRVMIAMAVALKPKLIIADEPTTALDVIVQDQIMDLFKELRDKFKTSILVISHDIALILEISDKVGVMYAGHLVEFSSSEELIENPLHPYTRELLKAIPNIEIEDQKLVSIPGSPPDLSNPPPGCLFHPRCPCRMDICCKDAPPKLTINGRLVECWLYGDKP